MLTALTSSEKMSTCGHNGFVFGSFSVPCRSWNRTIMSGTWLGVRVQVPRRVFQMSLCSFMQFLYSLAGFEVFATIKAGSGSGPGCRGSRSLELFGVKICNRGFTKLLSMGKSRFRRMRAAILKGAQHCPFDARYIAKGPREPSAAWLACHEFLTKLWLESAERLPDGLNSRKRPRQGSQKRDDPQMDRTNLKHLRPGSIRDYWMQCCAYNVQHRISRKLFSNASW